MKRIRISVIGKLFINQIKTRVNPRCLVKLSIIVFSKDRPLQLDGLLRSMKRHLAGNFSCSILWKATSKEMAAAYREVFETHAQNLRECCEENDFRRNLFSMISKTDSDSFLTFLVDDILFINPFDISWLRGINPFNAIPSLRLSPEISFCQPGSIETPPPSFQTITSSHWLKFSWLKSKGDWAMPLSVDGNIFSRDDIMALCEKIVFSAPNTFEQAMGPYRFLFKHRSGMCLKRPVIRNFAFNRVQTEIFDFPCGEISSEKFLQLWQNGMQLDIDHLAKVSARSCHVICEPYLTKRNIG